MTEFAVLFVLYPSLVIATFLLNHLYNPKPDEQLSTLKKIFGFLLPPFW